MPGRGMVRLDFQRTRLHDVAGLSGVFATTAWPDPRGQVVFHNLRRMSGMKRRIQTFYELELRKLPRGRRRRSTWLSACPYVAAASPLRKEASKQAHTCGRCCVLLYISLACRSSANRIFLEGWDRVNTWNVFHSLRGRVVFDQKDCEHCCLAERENVRAATGRSGFWGLGTREEISKSRKVWIDID